MKKNKNKKKSPSPCTCKNENRSKIMWKDVYTCMECWRPIEIKDKNYD